MKTVLSLLARRWNLYVPARKRPNLKIEGIQKIKSNIVFPKQAFSVLSFSGKLIIFDIRMVDTFISYQDFEVFKSFGCTQLNYTGKNIEFFRAKK